MNKIRAFFFKKKKEIPFTTTPYKSNPYQYLLDKGIKQTLLIQEKNYVK